MPQGIEPLTRGVHLSNSNKTNVELDGRGREGQSERECPRSMERRKEEKRHRHLGIHFDLAGQRQVYQDNGSLLLEVLGIQLKKKNAIIRCRRQSSQGAQHSTAKVERRIMAMLKSF